MAVKFPLKMSKGTQVKDIDELRKHFDLEAVLGYYANGRLLKWLEDRYYDEEAEKVRMLDSSLENLKEKLCAILGVPYMERMNTMIDIKDVVKKNERREILKKYTIDGRILDAADSVAFDQSELEDLLKKSDELKTDNDGNKVIYLYGEHFTIPAGNGEIIYKGVNNPTVEFDGEVVETGIDLQDDEEDFDEDEQGHIDANVRMFEQQWMMGMGKVETEYAIEGVKWLKKAVEQDSLYANLACRYLGKLYFVGLGVEQDYKKAVLYLKQAAESEENGADTLYCLGWCYYHGEGVKRDYRKAVKWLKRAAELEWAGMCQQGEQADAQALLAHCYYDGKGVEKNYKEYVRWLRKAAEWINEDVQIELGLLYTKGEVVEPNFLEAIKWFRRAAEWVNEDAQNQLEKCCSIFTKRGEKIVEYYRKATEQNDAEAQYYLGSCYENGSGTEIDIDEAREWYSKAAAQGHAKACEAESRCNEYDEDEEDLDEDEIIKQPEREIFIPSPIRLI